MEGQDGGMWGRMACARAKYVTVLTHMTYRSEIEDLRPASLLGLAPCGLGRTGGQARGRGLPTVLLTTVVDTWTLPTAAA